MKPDQKGLFSVFLVTFLMALSLHIQIPVFTPFAVALGASSFFVSIILSTSSFTSFAGHLLAGPIIDKFGKKGFIVAPLFISAVLITGYAYISSPSMLLLLRVVDSFVLAFLGPAALSLVSSYATTSRRQGKNMALHSLMFTIANILAPVIGGYLDTLYGYKETFHIVGISLFIAGAIALLFIKNVEEVVPHIKGSAGFKAILKRKGIVPLMIVGFAIMYGTGTLFYELPFLTVEQGISTAETGKLFSLMGLGTLCVLLLFGLQRLSALFRTTVGLMLLSLFYFQMATGIGHLHLGTTLFGMGAVFGLLFPALKTLLSERVGKAQYGTAFGLLSAMFSLGFILSSLVSGAIRHTLSPYFLAFLVVMIAAIYVISDHIKQKSPHTEFV